LHPLWEQGAVGSNPILATVNKPVTFYGFFVGQRVNLNVNSSLT